MIKENGLTGAEARKRLQKYGFNEIKGGKSRPALKILFEQFTNPLILVLIVASVIAFFLHEKADAIIIIGIVVINAILGFLQEYKAEKVVRELRKLIPMEAVVIRDGKKMAIDAKLLVPGDAVELKIGDIVPADIELIEVADLAADESSLTGESVPVEKSVKGKKPDSVLMGTNIVSGIGLGIVTATGEVTQFGKSAAYLKEPEERSDFEHSIADFSGFLLKIVLVMTAFIFIANGLLKHDFLGSFLFALALAVGITPESLPIVITISLAKGAQKLAKAHVIVKRLTSIEDIGNMDILCTDKTGTLTEGKLTLEKCMGPHGENAEDLLLYGLLCNDAIVSEHKIEGSIIDKAIWTAAGAHALKDDLKKYKILSKNAFDFERRRMSVLVEMPQGKRLLIAKGAVESIETLLKGDTKDFEKAVNEYRKKGYSTIAVAVKEIHGDSVRKSDEKQMKLAGFFAFLDPPRESAAASLANMKKLGVRIKVLSGDDPLVTETICGKVGLKIEGGKICTGDDLDKMSDKQFEEAVLKYNVFSRIAPAHKYRIVKALNKGRQITVGFMGDGINDAPALKVADVGISVNTATPIAKEAADIILMKKNLQVVVDGIMEGRKIFTNITKYIVNTVSANFGNMFTVAFSSVFMKFIPLLPSQILLNNLITDTPMLTIAMDNVDKESLRKPKKLDIKMINSFMRFFGLISTFFDLTLILVLLLIFKADQDVFRSAWFFESALSEIIITFAIRTQKPFWKSAPSKILLGWSLAMVVVLVALFLPTPLADFFHFTMLPPAIWALVAVLVVAYFVIAETAKRVFAKKYSF